MPRRKTLVCGVATFVILAGFAQAATLSRTEGEDRYDNAPPGECNNESPSNLTVTGASGGKVVILPYNACWVKLRTYGISNAAVVFGMYQPSAQATDCFQLDVYTMGQVDLLQGSTEQYCGTPGLARRQLLNSGSIQHFSGDPSELKVKGTRVAGALSIDMGIDYIEYISGATVRESETPDATSGACATTGASSATLAGTNCYAEWIVTLPANAQRMELRARVASGIGLDTVTLTETVDGVTIGANVLDNRNWITYTYTDLAVHDAQHTHRLTITAATPSTASVELDWLQWPH